MYLRTKRIGNNNLVFKYEKAVFETILKCLVFQSVIALLNTHHSLGSLNTLSTLEKRESFLQHWRERESMDNLRNHTIGQRQI